MRLKEDYLITQIHNHFYLLPSGQSRASFCPPYEINEIGSYICRLLEKEISKEEIINSCFNFYEISKKEAARAQKIIDDFLFFLKNAELLENNTIASLPSQKHKFTSFTPCEYLDIGNIRLGFSRPLNEVKDWFKGFEIKNLKEIKQIQDTEKSMYPLNIDLKVSKDYTPEGKTLIFTKDLKITAVEGGYFLEFCAFNTVKYGFISNSGDYGEIICEKLPDSREDREELFNALRHFYLFASEQLNEFALHSASVLYEGKLYLFSAMSGVGKSTQAKLWEKHLGATQINGDLNLICNNNDSYETIGIPWCGTSEINSPLSHKIGAVFMIKQGTNEEINLLSTHRAALSLSQRSVSPAWNKEMLQKNITFFEAFAQHIPVFEMYCTPTENAVKAALKALQDSDRL
ncbi:MAG: PqqD family protein [Lachnospiraceae bacterium]|nr:PqqD family protein [Lachnospiraceae bacterium]